MDFSTHEPFDVIDYLSSQYDSPDLDSPSSPSTSKRLYKRREKQLPLRRPSIIIPKIEVKSVYSAHYTSPVRQNAPYLPIQYLQQQNTRHYATPKSPRRSFLNNGFALHSPMTPSFPNHNLQDLQDHLLSKHSRSQVSTPLLFDSPAFKFECSELDAIRNAEMIDRLLAETAHIDLEPAPEFPVDEDYQSFLDQSSASHFQF